MGRMSGVVLDWYDDHGDTLKSKFPTPDSLPGVIKEADIKPLEKLDHADFALVAIDGGDVLHKFACHDPGTTAMSVIYFMEHGDKLPEEAQKTAAWNLSSKCAAFGIEGPPALRKLAMLAPNCDKSLDKVGSVRKGAVDITGKRPQIKVKQAQSRRSEDYAVVLPDGRHCYPIYSWDLVKKAEEYFQDEKKRMEPEIRRQYATKLAAKACSMGYPLDPEISDLGAVGWASEGHLKAAVEMRKVACDPKGDSRLFLEELFEKRSSIEPDVYAEALRRFDVKEGLDRLWDNYVLDPWASTFGINKTAEVLWDGGNDRVTTEQLTDLAQNRLCELKKVFTEDVCKEFQKNPVAIFDSMPTPQKKLICRMASDHPEQSEVAQIV